MNKIIGTITQLSGGVFADSLWIKVDTSEDVEFTEIIGKDVEVNFIEKHKEPSLKELTKDVFSELTELCKCGHSTNDHSYNPDDLTNNLECDKCNCMNFVNQKSSELCPCGHVHEPSSNGNGLRTYCVEGSQCNSDKCKDFVNQKGDEE